MRTRREAYKELREKHGIVSSSMFHGDLDEEISDESFDRMVKIMTIAFDDLGDEDDDDDL